MKTTRTITLAIGLALITSAVWAGLEDPVNFPDENLKEAVEGELAKQGIQPPIKENDMLALTDLDANYRSIADLTGLGYAHNLTSLILGHNQISDISPLSGLANLTYLDLPSNQIGDISSLSGLTNLTDLYLANNQVGNISSVSGMTSLTTLNLHNNQVSDISPVSGLASLTTLSLSYNQISDISSLSGSSLTDLTYLSLANNQISDISFLSGLTTLTSLELSWNQISNISSLSSLLNLTYLALYYNQISDISSLSSLTNLTHLDLYNNQIRDISSLSGLTNLTRLALYNNEIGDISSLSGLTSLTRLVLYNNQISDISSLSGLTSLMHLKLCDNEISDISSLSDFADLKNLGLYGNPLDCASYDIYIPLIETNNAGVSITYDPRPAHCDSEADIDVSPWDYDYGDVAYGTSSNVLVTICNMGNGDLVLESLEFTPESSSDFVITSAPTLPCVVTPVENVDIEVTFTPSTAFMSTAVLEVSSDDPDEPVVEVILRGLGVDVPPVAQLQYILAFIDACVADDILAGDGPGESAENRLNALINMFEATGTLIAGGYFEDACEQLVDILQKCDGQLPTPDFVAGEAAEELANMIRQLMDDLGCE